MYKRQRNYRELKDASAHREAILVATKGESNGLGIVHLTETDRYAHFKDCLLYTSDAADERSSVDLGGRRIIKKKKKSTTR